MFENAERIILDDFHGEGARNLNLLSNLDIDKDALIGFLAFTENDFVGSFKKGKTLALKLLESSSYFKSVFRNLEKNGLFLYEELQ